MLKLQLLLGIFLIFVAYSLRGFTDPRDVAAINSLYVSLGSPVLPGWVASGGDPCGEAWQGVQCNNSNISSIILSGANLGGDLGNNLDAIASIVAIDLSNNHIGGSIPSSLSIIMKNLPTMSEIVQDLLDMMGGFGTDLALTTSGTVTPIHVFFLAKPQASVEESIIGITYSICPNLRLAIIF